MTERPIGGPEDREGNPVAPRRLSEDDFVAATSAQPVKDISLPDDDLRERLVKAGVTDIRHNVLLPEWMQLPALGRDMTPLSELVVDAVLPLIREELAEAERRGRDDGLDDAYTDAVGEASKTFDQDGENTPATDACLRIAKRIRERHSMHAANVEARQAAARGDFAGGSN